MKNRALIQLFVLISFFPLTTALAAHPTAKPIDKIPEKSRSVLIRPADEWKNPLFQKEEVSWLKAAMNPTWMGDRLGVLQLDERVTGGGIHSDSQEFHKRVAWIYGQDLLVNLTKNQRDDWGRKLDSQLDQIGNQQLTNAQKTERLEKHAKDEWAALLFKRILQHEAVKARFQVVLTEERIQYVIRRFLLDVGRQLLSVRKKSHEKDSGEAGGVVVTVSGKEDLSKLSNEKLFERVLGQIELRTQADPAAVAKKNRLGVGYGLDWAAKVDGMEQEYNLMLDADDALIKSQRRPEDDSGGKSGKNWVDWVPIRIEFKEFPGNFDEYTRSVREQVQKKQTDLLLTAPVLKNAWMGVLRKNIQLPLRGETLGLWPRSSEVLRIYNERQRKLEVLSWTLEGPKNAEFAEIILNRLSERGEAWIQEQFAQKFGSELGSDKNSVERLREPYKEQDPAKNLSLVFERIMNELMAESSQWVKKGQLSITTATETIEFNEFDVAQTTNQTLRQLVGRGDGGMRLFPVAQDSTAPLNTRKKITLSFRLSIDSGNPIQNADKISADARAYIAGGIREKALQFEIKRTLYKLFQSNPFKWVHNVCEQPEWPCLDASPKALTEALMPEALAEDWEHATGVKSTMDLVDRGNEWQTQSALEKVNGFDSRKLNAILQLE